MTPTYTGPLDFYAALCCTDASIYIDCFALVLGGVLFGVLIGIAIARKDHDSH
jgi:hypothetical protein